MNTTRGTAAALALGLAVTAGLAGCIESPEATPPEKSGPARLVAFDSCKQALRDLKAAAEPYVGAYGFEVGSSGAGRERSDDGRAEAPAAGAEAPGEKDSAPDHSGTNNHEAGVDEPDLVKTDGRRIVTVVNGVLTVVDVASREVTGSLSVTGDNPRDVGADSQLLLHGDRALVVFLAAPIAYDRPSVDGEDQPTPYRDATTEVVLVDLSGPPEVLSRMKLDGGYVDARMVDGQVRLVTHTAPRVPFKRPSGDDSESAIRDNKAVLAESTIENWLPRYEIETGDTVAEGTVGCEHLRRPAAYTGTSMLTVMSLGMETKGLSGEHAVSIVADGRTVYGTGDHLYVANDRRAVRPPARPAGSREMPEPRTELFKFDVSKPGVPRHVASGAVPGWLLNQYSMSEYDGYLRVATTSAGAWSGTPDEQPRTESAVYVLGHKGSRLTQVGHVGGLGKGERIYSARFVGPVGYLVTFRQVDPLYVLDLRNPEHPKKTGELKITGYSAYLHPAGAGRLIGVGQEASTEGRTEGLQVSLFDVSDPTAPARLARHHLRNANSAAEYDPHAFLYWEKTGLLVLPVTSHRAEPTEPGKPAGSSGGALVLKISGESITEVGTVAHPDGGYPGMVRRSMMIGDTLWTVSTEGLQANDGATLEERAWIPFQ
ncbi:MAG: beta-propeller domain-containing protein [Micromonosporaceae bacterium]